MRRVGMPTPAKQGPIVPNHPSNRDYPYVPPLPTPPVKALEVVPPEIVKAWEVWNNTLFLSGGDRAAADRAFDVYLRNNQQR